MAGDAAPLISQDKAILDPSLLPPGADVMSLEWKRHHLGRKLTYAIQAYPDQPKK
jgi:hypothetical protein